MRTTENKALTHRYTSVQAEQKLQEHGLHQPAKTTQEAGILLPTASPEEFAQMMTPKSLGIRPCTSQTGSGDGSQPEEEMDFSDINFAEFSDFDQRYAL